MGISTEKVLRVAPREGAWIEINSARLIFLEQGVAPREGAWIEMGIPYASYPTNTVAPREGAWIEISYE